MPGFAALVDKIQTGSVQLRGQTIELKALSIAQTDRILAMIPRPTPPLVKDPNKGSLAPLIPNEQDPAYQKDLKAWSRKMQLAELALASGEFQFDSVITLGQTTPEERATSQLRFLNEAIDHLANLLSPEEMMACSKEVMRLGAPTAGVEASIPN